MDCKELFTEKFGGFLYITFEIWGQRTAALVRNPQRSFLPSQHNFLHHSCAQTVMYFRTPGAPDKYVTSGLCAKACPWDVGATFGATLETAQQVYVSLLTELVVSKHIFIWIWNNPLLLPFYRLWNSSTKRLNNLPVITEQEWGGVGNKKLTLPNYSVLSSTALS